jgi:DNA topoisomerase-1
VYRNGRYGRFIACSNFPKCHYSRPLDGKEKEKPEPTGKMCPKCGGELLKRKSRYGTYFLGCSNFPACHYMETLDGEEIVPKKKGAAAGRRGSSSRKTASKKTAAKKKKTPAKRTQKKAEA